MKIVKITGGLGNQMLQYAFGEYLTLHGIDVKYDVTEYQRYHMHNGYILENVFDIEVNKASYSDLKNVKMPYLYFIFNLYVYKYFAYRIRTKHIFEKDFELEKYLNGNWYFDGTWMKYKYVESVESKMNILFKFKNSVIDDVNSIINRVNSTEAIAVHFRRGDYVQNPKANSTHGTVSFEYYKYCITKLKQETKNGEFFIFTDDFDWVKKNIYIFDDCKYYLVNEDRKWKDYHELLIMKSCRHFILANSTFSWWGAWLSRTKGNVYFPKRWFRKENLNAEISSVFFPVRWIGVEL